jgi:hypothetical protein
VGPVTERPGRRAQIEELLRRYPKVSDSETSQIRNFILSSSRSDFDQLAQNEVYRDKVARIIREAPGKSLKGSLKGGDVFTALLMMALLAVFCWQYLV